jgi:DNA-binding NtrC family response regulator
LSVAARKERILIIGPLAADWTRDAQVALRDAGFSATRFSDVDLMGMLLAAGGVKAVLVDARLIVPSLMNRIARLQAADLRFPVVVIDAQQERVADGDPNWPLRVSWPAEIDRLLTLVRQAGG